MADRWIRPVFSRHVSNIGRGDETHQRIPLRDGRGAQSKWQEVLIYQLMYRNIGRNSDRVKVHHLAHRDPLQDRLQFNLRLCALCGVQEEPTNKSNPEATEKAPGEELDNANENEEI